MGQRPAAGIASERLLVPLAISCSLCVLACMLTGRLSAFNGVEYHLSAYSAFSLCVVASFFLLLPFCNRPVVRLGVNLASLAALVVWSLSLGLYWLFESSGGDAATPLLVVIRSACRLFLLASGIQLNYYAARAKERDISAGAIVIASLTVSMYLTLALLPNRVSSTCVLLLCLVTVLVMLHCDCAEIAESKERKRNGDTHPNPSTSKVAPQEARDGKPLWLSCLCFFTSRAAWGAANGAVIGLSTALPVSVSTGPGITLAIIIASAATLLVTLQVERHEHVPTLFAVLAPSMAYLLILACFMQGDFFAYGRMVGALTFLPWFIQVYVQLPSYGRLLGMNLARFAYLEKMSSLLTYQLSQGIVLRALVGHDLATGDLGLFQTMLACAAFALVLLSASTMFRHLVLYYPVLRSPIAPPEVDEAPDAIESVATAHSLSSREREVLRLLASGYSGPYIEKALSISKGTVKTHTYRIYRKLGVNSQDEVIDLVLDSKP